MDSHCLNIKAFPVQVIFLVRHLGQAQAVGSVQLITHSDQLDGINWPNDVSVSVGGTCAPQNIGPGHLAQRAQCQQRDRGSPPRTAPTA